MKNINGKSVLKHKFTLEQKGKTLRQENNVLNVIFNVLITFRGVGNGPLILQGFGQN